MHTLLQDLRYAFRQLWKSPGFTIAAVLSLAIGIGINTAIFSNMDAVVLHPLAVPQLDRVVTVAEQKGAAVTQAATSRWRWPITRTGSGKAARSNRWPSAPRRT